MALLALTGAAQALAPASAGALINQSGDGTCTAIDGMPGSSTTGPTKLYRIDPDDTGCASILYKLP